VRKAKADPAGESKPPSTRELASLLGRSHAAFLALTQRGSAFTCEWKRYGKKSPWVLKVSQADRTLLYATPMADAFEATVVLGERAAQAALAGRVSKHTGCQAVCGGTSRASYRQGSSRPRRCRGTRGCQTEPDR
jgi:hypothetical protein